MKDHELLLKIAVIILIVGGLNWGLVGLFKFNLVEAIFGNTLSRIIYIVVGAAATAKLYFMFFAKSA